MADAPRPTPISRRRAKQFQLAWAEKLPKIPLADGNNIWVAQKSVMGYTPLQSKLYPLYNDVWLDA